MKSPSDFASQLNAHLALNLNFVVRKGDRYFLLNEVLTKLTRSDFYYAGTYLGKAKDDRFFPSFNLLAVLSRGKANKIMVDKKTAWLFICGRDIFRKGILRVEGSKRKGDHTLVLNEYGECLGFGRIIRSLDEKEAQVVVKNILDAGDFLRREK